MFTPIYTGGADFGAAIAHLKSGGKAARQNWNGKGMYLELQVPDENSKMTLPYIYMKTADDQLVPWLASQSDVLAEDWVALYFAEDKPVIIGDTYTGDEVEDATSSD